MNHPNDYQRDGDPRPPAGELDPEDPRRHPFARCDIHGVYLDANGHCVTRRPGHAPQWHRPDPEDVRTPGR